MYEHFAALNEQKQRRIVEAALREFGRYGYRKTSAEQIAGAAGIGKGMLFRYFGSKRGLFEYLLAYTNDYLVRWFGGLDDQMKGLDFIEQYRLMTQIKLRSYQDNPSAFEFMAMLFLYPENQEVSEVIRAEYAKIIAFRTQALTDLYTGNNAGPFRADIPPEKAKKYIAWMIDGYSQEMLAIFKRQPLVDLDDGPYWDEFDAILDDLKRLFYQPA